MFEDTNIKFVETLDEAQEMVRWFGTQHNGPIAIDTETTGLEWWTPNAGVRLTQFGDSHTAWAIDFRRWRGLVEDCCKMWTGGWVGHNLSFDMSFLQSEGIHLKGDLIDTMLMSQFVRPGFGHSLKGLSEKHVGEGSAAGQRLLAKAMDEQKWTWATVPIDFPIYWAYGAFDCILTRRLWDYFMATYPTDFETEGWEIEKTVMPVLQRMQMRGIAVDTQYTHQKRAQLVQYVDEMRVWAKEEYGIANMTSGAQLARTLIADGVRLTEKTPSDAWQMDKAVLLTIDHPLASAVLDVRSAIKIANTYLAHLESPIARCNIKQQGAHTGRMSITGTESSCALQTLPRGTAVRDAFIPREGKKLISCDFDQIEMRVLAEYCKDPGLVAAIMSGDLHLETARRAYKEPSMLKSDPRRQTAKNAGFAKIYGAGTEKFAMTAGITVEDAQQFLDSYDEEFPGVSRFAGEVNWHMKTADEKCITSVFGRKQWAKDRDFAVLNYLVQGTAGELFKRQLVRLSIDYDDCLLVPVHDEIIAEADEADVEEVAHGIEETMTFREWIVPCTASAGVYGRWGDKYRKDTDVAFQDTLTFYEWEDILTNEAV